MHKIGVLAEGEKKLDYVLGLTIEQFLERRLQTIVARQNISKSMHEARALIFQKRISIRRSANKHQVVNIASYIVNSLFNEII